VLLRSVIESVASGFLALRVGQVNGRHHTYASSDIERGTGGVAARKRVDHGRHKAGTAAVAIRQK